MNHADFSLTYNFLDHLATYDKQIGKMKSFFVVHIGGGLTTGVTTVIDTLFHLAACITKVATGIFATPIAYFTRFHRAEEWSWSAAGKHFLQAANHAFGFIAVPATLFFGPKAALNLLFPHKVKLTKLQKQNSRNVLLQDQLERIRYNEANEERNLRAELNQRERSQIHLQNQIQNLEMQLSVERNEARQKSCELNVSQMNKGNKFDDRLISSLRNQLSVKQEEVNVLSSRCEEYATKFYATKNENELMKSSVNNLEKELRNEVQQHQQCNNQFKILERKYNEINNERHNSEIAQQLQDKIIEISEMYERNREMNKVIESDAQELEIISEELDDQKVRNNKLINELNQSKNKIEENAQDIFNIRALSEKQTHEITRLKSQEHKVPSQISKELVEALDKLAGELICPVDYELLEKAIIVVPCGHRFNAEVLNSTKIGDNCSICRGKIAGLHEDKNTSSLATKMKTISTILKKQGVELNSL
ncbi:MAG: hypothetical protein H0W50_08390 [Parachlamydiaceae bacterium]|nr:hypothetical protein [Parachlamydiaceae bacterium]